MGEFDLGKAIGYVFKDPSWISKLLIAALMVPLIFVFLIGLFVLNGYVIEIARRVADDDPNPLPEWNDFGGYLSNGFIAAVGLFVWMIPVILFICCGGFFLADTDSIAANLGFNFAVSTIGGIYFAVFGPLVLAKYAMERQLSSMFNVGEIFGAIPKVLPGIFLVFIVSFVSNIIAPITILAFCIGIFVFAAYVSLVQAHLYGQIARAAFRPDMPSSTTHPAF